MEKRFLCFCYHNAKTNRGIRKGRLKKLQSSEFRKKEPMKSAEAYYKGSYTQAWTFCAPEERKVLWLRGTDVGEAEGRAGGIGRRANGGPMAVCEITAPDAEAARLAIAYILTRLQRPQLAADPDYEIAVEVVECAWYDNRKAWLEDD